MKIIKWLLIIFLVVGQLMLPLKASAETNNDVPRQGTSIKEIPKAKTTLTSNGIEVRDVQDNGITPEQLVKSIVGSGIEVQNIRYNGAAPSAGLFSGGKDAIGIENGLLLSTGHVKGVVGPNTSGNLSGDMGTTGDSDLLALFKEEQSDITLYDASILEFQFKPTTDTVSFQYVMASEEYLEYIEMSDVFGFFVNGQNIAYLPGTNTPVTITNVNHLSNAEFYKDNGVGHFNTEMDGMTTVLNAQANVNSGEWNTIKLAIADFGDSIWDSNVFIKAESLNDRPAEPGMLRITNVEYSDPDASVQTATLSEDKQVEAEITVERFGGSDGTVTTGWKLIGDNDEILNEGTLIFEDGETSKTFTATLNKELRNVRAELLNPTGGVQFIEGGTSINVSVKRIFANPAETEQITIHESETIQLEVFAEYLDESVEDITDKATIVTKSTNINISPEGVITATTAGNASVKILYAGHSTSKQISILPIINSIELTPTTIELEAGETQLVETFANYSDGSQKEILEGLEYSSSDEEIFTISDNGELTAHKAGQAELSAFYKDHVVIVEVTVTTSGTKKELKLTVTEHQLLVGDQSQINLFEVQEDGTEIDVTHLATYKSTDEQVLQVDPKGLITAIATGEANVIVSYIGQELDPYFFVNDAPVHLENIVFEYPQYELRQNDSLTPKVIANYSNSTSEEITQQVDFTISDSDILQTENNMFIGKQPGEVQVTATFNGKSAETSVTVLPIVESLSLQETPATLDHLTTQQLQVTAHYSNSTQKDVTTLVNYSTSDTNIVKVDENGLLTAVTPGQSKLRVEYEGVTTEIDLEVVKVLKKIEFEKSSYEFLHGDTIPLKVTAEYSDNSSKDITEEVEYSISNSDVITVDPQGEMHGLEPGTTILKAEFQGKQAETSVTIKPKLLRITFDQSDYQFKTGNTYEINIKAHYSDSSIVDVTKECEVISSAPDVLFLEQSGLLTAKKQGESTLSARYSGMEVTAIVKVVPKDTSLEIKVTDQENGSKLSGALVVIEDETGKFQNFVYQNGEDLNYLTKPGTYKIYAYQNGYIPSLQTVLLGEGQTLQVNLKLKKGNVINGDLKAEKMSLEEIVAAGIDVNNPDNQYVYEFKVFLNIDGQDFNGTYMFNGTGNYVKPYIPINLGKSGFAYPVVIPVPGKPDVPPTVGYMVIPGEVRWLKEFFTVDLTLQNMAPEGIDFDNAHATLDLPDGLSLAPIQGVQNLEINLGQIKGGETKSATWYVRGDKKGDYKIQATFEGNLKPFDVDVSIPFESNTFKVWGEEALKMTVAAQAKASIGMPYHVRFSLTNVSDGDVNLLNFKLKNEGKKNFIYSPGTRLEYKIDKLKAGETVSFDYLLIPFIAGNLDLSDSFVISDSEIEIPVEIVVIKE